MRIPFDIKYRPQIESGEYKVVTRADEPVRIICWDKKNYNPIVYLLLSKGGCEHIMSCTLSGLYSDGLDRDSDLFIITPEPELSEFDDCVRRLIDMAHSLGKDHPNNTDKGALLEHYSAELLSLAREQFIKDGYVIEKKAFHDAVKKVDPEVMREVSENVDKANEELTEFEKELESFYNHHLQVCTYDNQGTVEDSLHDGASKLLALAKKELCEQIVDNTKEAYENGKAEALKDLPRWEKDDSIKAEQYITVGKNGERFHYKGHSLLISNLTKLPGFKEDE